MKTNERIARGVYRLILVVGLLITGGFVVTVIVELFTGSTGLTVGEAFGSAAGAAAGTYVFALLVRWIIRGFGSDE